MQLRALSKLMRLSRLSGLMGVGCVPSLQGRARVGLVLFILIIFTSCSSDQYEPEVKHTLIAFSANQQEQEVTRAGSTPLSDYTTYFRVWGFKNMSTGTQTVFPGYAVQWETGSAQSSTTNTQGWDYILMAYPDQTPKYWDFEAQAYRFFAVAEMSATPGTWTTTTDTHSYTCTVNANNAEDAPFYTHLWYSNGNATDYPTRQFGQPVTLEFIKPFAEVRFMFTYSDPSAEPLPMLEDPDFRPVNSQRIATAGEVTISFPIQGTEKQESWTSTVDDTRYLLAFTVPKTLYTVLPVMGQNAYVLNVTVNGEDKTCNVPAQYMKWSPGYRYTYLFKVNEDGGVELDQVSIGVKNWEEGGNKEHIIYNW